MLLNKSKIAAFFILVVVVLFVFTNDTQGAVPAFFSGKKVPYNTHFDNQPIDIYPIDWNKDGTRDVIIGFNDGRIGVFYNEGTDVYPEYRTVVYLQSGGFDLNANCSGWTACF